jgi:flagellar basal-body rod modification protein FlgD
MSVTSVNSYYTTSAAATNPATTAKSSNAELDFNDLLKIIVTQLSQQDPGKAASTTDLVNQYMSIANLQSSTTLKTNSETEVAQARQTFAANLVGKKVDILDSNANPLTGVIEKARVSGKSILITISGTEYDSSSIQNYLQ